MNLVQTFQFIVSWLPSPISELIIAFISACIIFGIFHLVVFIKKLFLFG